MPLNGYGATISFVVKRDRYFLKCDDETWVEITAGLYAMYWQLGISGHDVKIARIDP